MNLRRLAFIAACLLVSSTWLFASGQTEGTTEGASSQKTVTWTLWDDPAANGQQAVADMFMKDNPGYQVVLNRVPYDRYEDKVRTELAAGDAPDLVQVNDDYVVTYTKRGLIQPVTKYLSTFGIKGEDYFKPLWDFNWYDKQLMAISPVDKVRLIVYNRDMVKAAGLADPSPTWANPNWNFPAFLSYAEKLTKHDGTRTSQWGFVGFGDGGLEQTFIANANGEGLFGSDGKTCSGCNPAAITAVQFLADMMHKQKVTPLWGDQNTGGKVDNVFLSGQAAMKLGGNWNIAQLRTDAKFDWDLASIPMDKFDTNEPSLVCYAIPKTAKSPDTSAKLLFYMLGEKSQQAFASMGLVPANVSFAEKYAVTPNVKPDHQKVVLDAMKYAKSVNFTENTDEAKRVYRVWLYKVWAGEMTAKDALTQAKPEVEKALSGN
ncbi:MAG TPA: sugar ABC transporter substrate-binding protein [Spirochaetia bacterium]|nr:sugar ABC transporter substrate-binding protein [Spirochaetia bacterium]